MTTLELLKKAKAAAPLPPPRTERGYMNDYPTLGYS